MVVEALLVSYSRMGPIVLTASKELADSLVGCRPRSRPTPIRVLGVVLRHRFGEGGAVLADYVLHVAQEDEVDLVRVALEDLDVATNWEALL